MNLNQLLDAVDASSEPRKTLHALLNAEYSPVTYPVPGLPSSYDTTPFFSRINPQPAPAPGGTPAGQVSPIGGNTPGSYLAQPEPFVSSQAEEGMSPLGFLGNVVSGVGGIATGVTGLLGAAGHDLAQGIANVLPGEQAVERTPSALKGLAGAMFGYDAWMPQDTGGLLGVPQGPLGLPEGQDAPSAIMEDFKMRYGPLFRGDLAEFGRQLYEKPVMFGLDALMVAGAPGAAVKGADWLTKGAPVFGKTLYPGISREGALAGDIARASRFFRGPGRVVYPLGGTTEGISEAGLILPSAEMVGKAGGVSAKLSVNPLVRAGQRALHNLVTDDSRYGIELSKDLLGRLHNDPAVAAQFYDELVAKMGTANAGEALDYMSQVIQAAAVDAIDDARFGYGIGTRIYKPGFRKRLMTSTMRARQAYHGAALIDMREAISKQVKLWMENADPERVMDIIQQDATIPPNLRLSGYQDFNQPEYTATGQGILPGFPETRVPGTAPEIPPPLTGPLPGQRQLIRETPTGGLYPNPGAIDFSGGAGLTRGTPVIFDDGTRARYMHTTPEGLNFFDFGDGNGPVEGPALMGWRVMEQTPGDVGEMASRLGIELPETAPRKVPKAPKVTAPKVAATPEAYLSQSAQQVADLGLHEEAISNLLKMDVRTANVSSDALYSIIHDQLAWAKEFRPDNVKLIQALETKLKSILDESTPEEANLIRTAYAHEDARRALVDLQNKFDEIDQMPDRATELRWDKRIAAAEKKVADAKAEAEAALQAMKAPEAAAAKVGEGKIVWNGQELEPGSTHLIKDSIHDRARRYTIIREGYEGIDTPRTDSPMNTPGIVATYKGRGGEVKTFIRYESIDAIDGLKRDVQAEQAARGGLSLEEEAAAQEAFAAKLNAAEPPSPVQDAVALAKAKIDDMEKLGMKLSPEEKAAIVREHLDTAGIEVPEAPAPMELAKAKPIPPKKKPPAKAKPATKAVAAPRNVVEPSAGPLEVPIPGYVGEDRYVVQWADGADTFFDRDSAQLFADTVGGEVIEPTNILPGRLDITPISQIQPPATPPIEPFTTVFRQLPPENLPELSPLGDIAPQARALTSNRAVSEVGEIKNASDIGTYFTVPRDGVEPRAFMISKVDNLRNADQYAQAAANITGDELVGVFNTLNDGMAGTIRGGDLRYGAQRGYVAFYRTPEGTTYAIQFITPNMEAPLRAAGLEWQTLRTQVEPALNDTIAEFRAAVEAQDIERAVKLQQDIIKLTDAADAHLRKAAGWNEAVVRDLANPGGYDINYMAADQIPAIFHNSTWGPKLANGELHPLEFSAADELDRAFLPMRTRKFHSWQAALRTDLDAIEKTMVDTKAGTKAAVEQMRTLVKEQFHRIDDVNKFDWSKVTDSKGVAQGYLNVDDFVDRAIFQMDKKGALHISGPAKGKGQTLAQYVDGKVHEWMSPVISDGPTWQKDFFNYTWKKLDEAIPQANMPKYFGHIRLDRLGPGGYLGKFHNMQTVNTREPVDIMSKNRGILAEDASYADPRYLPTIEEYRRWYPKATDNELALYRLNDGRKLINDVYTIKATSILRHRQIVDMIDEIKNLARPVNPIEVENGLWRMNQMKGYRLVNFDALKLQVKLREKLWDKIYSDIANGIDETDSVAQRLPEIFDEAEGMAIDQLLKDGGKGARLYAVPEYLIQDFQRNVGRALGWKWRMTFDSGMNVWKQSVLAFSPRWLVNNTFGNTIFSLIKDPGAIAEMLRLRDKQYRRMWEFALGNKWPEGVERGLFAEATQRVTHYGQAEIEAPKWTGTYRALKGEPSTMAAELPRELRPGLEVYQKFARGMHRASDRMRLTNAAIEDSFRRGIFVSGLKKEMAAGSVKGFYRDAAIFEELMRNPVRSRAFMDAAIERVNSTLGDYTKLGPLERGVVRRFLLPFYPFYKHVFKFMVKMPFEHPYKAAMLLAFGRLDEEMHKNYPEYLDGTVGIGMLAGGQQLLLRVRSMNPLESLNPTGTGVFSSMNPLAQAFTQYQLGINTFSGMPYSRPDIKESPSGQKVQIIRDDNGNVISIRVLPDNYRAKPEWDVFLTNLFPQLGLARGLLSAAQGQSGARWSGTGDVIIDPATGKPRYPQPWFTGITGMLGAPLTTANPEEMAYDQAAKDEYAKQQYIKEKYGI